MREEQPNEALRHVLLSLRVRSSSPDAHLLAARASRHTGAYREAEEHLERAVRLLGGPTERTQLEWVLLRAQRGEIDEVAPGLWACVEQDHPETEEVLATMARRYLAELRFQPALTCLNRWLELRPNAVRALDWRGWVLERTKQTKAAARDYEKALELAPGRAAVRLRLVEVLLERNDPGGAQSHLEELRRNRPHDPDVLVVLARCAMLLGNHEAAEQALDEALATSPNHVGALLHRARLALALHRPAEAEAWLRQALQTKPGDVDLLYNLALALQQQPGRKQEAIAALRRHEQVKADLETLSALLSQPPAYLQRDPDRAAEAGRILLNAGQDQGGLFWLEVALKRDPGHPAANEALARYYEKKGEAEKARDHRRRAQERPKRPRPSARQGGSVSARRARKRETSEARWRSGDREEKAYL